MFKSILKSYSNERAPKTILTKLPDQNHLKSIIPQTI